MDLHGVFLAVAERGGCEAVMLNRQGQTPSKAPCVMFSQCLLHSTSLMSSTGKFVASPGLCRISKQSKCECFYQSQVIPYTMLTAVKILR